MKLLHIDSSVLGPHSVSRQVSAAAVERLRQAHPGLVVSYRDLSPHRHFDQILKARREDDFSATMFAHLQRGPGLHLREALGAL